MDDTLLDGWSAMNAAWGVVCANVGERFGVDCDHMREVFRKRAAEFWKDESAVEHWRVRLVEARAVIIEEGLRDEGLDATVAMELSQMYAEQHRAGLALFDDALATLENVRKAGLKLGLLTNGPAYMQRDKIERFDLARHFDVIVIEGEFGHGKPHPKVFQHALDATGVAPDLAWHVGDNLYADVSGAKGMGIKAAWIHRERLAAGESPPAKPDAEIAHLHELNELLGI